jgi:hypothetical protein
MSIREEKLNEHERLRELAALANSGALSNSEWDGLNNHLRTCEECREAYRQYQILAKEGFPILAVGYEHQEADGSWDDSATRKSLLARVASMRIPRLVQDVAKETVSTSNHHGVTRVVIHPMTSFAIAACLIVVVSAGAYRYARTKEDAAKRAIASAQASVAMSADNRLQKLSLEKNAEDEAVSAQAQKLTQLEAQSAAKQQQIETLQAELQAVKSHADELTASRNSSDEQLRAVSQQRDAIASQLHDAQQGYQRDQGEVINLRTERDKAVLRLTSLETQINELSSANRDQQQRLDRAEEFLASSRDIRELMGARNLYISDVFDVDSSSRTKKPFGRVFYTQSKSLIFYAFDLEKQPGVKTVSAFQAWGQRETPSGEKAQPVSLGILYIDNEANRRWALHCDDPKQLAEIDAVFVTVEPHGGSQKPTGKPFLFAILRKEANHP